jgi:hypothetical protein
MVKTGFVDLEAKTNENTTRTKNNVFKNIFNSSLILVLIIITPFIELGVGYTYFQTTLCKYYEINGTSVLISNGVFGIIYLICFIVCAFVRPFNFNESLCKNLSKSHFIFKIITMIHSTLLILFMILEVIFLSNCTDLTLRVAAGLWLAVLTTVLAIVYVLVQLFSCVLC